MTTLEVTFTTRINLECSCELPVDVRLWVKDGFVAYVPCEGTEGDQTVFVNFVNASLIKKTRAATPSGSCGPWYTYTFQYEDTELQTNLALGPPDILGILCLDTSTTYIDQKIGEEPYIEQTEEGSFVFHGPHGCEFVWANTFQSMPPSEPADGDIPLSKVAFWIDEGTDTLNIKAKKSDGTIVTGSIALS